MAEGLLTAAEPPRLLMQGRACVLVRHAHCQHGQHCALFSGVNAAAVQGFTACSGRHGMIVSRCLTGALGTYLPMASSLPWRAARAEPRTMGMSSPGKLRQPQPTAQVIHRNP